jgi:hypothetical protein
VWEEKQMKEFPLSMLTESIIILLTEAYPGPPDPTATWFIDNDPDSGILGILRDVTAVEASTSVDGTGNPGTTIASHAEHLHWSLANMNRAMSGGDFGKWSESWDLKEANAAEWDRLRRELRKEFEQLCQVRPHRSARCGISPISGTRMLHCSSVKAIAAPLLEGQLTTYV